MKKFLIILIGVVLLSATPFYCANLDLVQQETEVPKAPTLIQNKELPTPVIEKPRYAPIKRQDIPIYPIYPMSPATTEYYNCTNMAQVAQYVSTAMTNFQKDIKIKYTGKDYDGWINRNLYNIFENVYRIDTMTNLNDGERLHYSFSYATTDYTYYDNSELITIHMYYRNGLDKAKQDKTDAWIRNEYKKLNVDGKSEYKRFLEIYKYCIKPKYDTTFQKWSDYDVMAYGTTVCSGYAMLLDKMCEVAGIDCRCATGHTNGVADYTEYHAWNYVKIDGKWYFCDPCWDEPDNGKYFNYFLISYKSPQFKNRLLDDHFYGNTKNSAILGQSIFTMLPMSQSDYKITVKYDTKKGNKISSKKCRPGVEISLKKPKRSGYKFVYYYTTINGKKKRVKRFEFVPFENVTVHAKWKRI